MATTLTDKRSLWPRSATSTAPIGLRHRTSHVNANEMSRSSARHRARRLPRVIDTTTPPQARDPPDPPTGRVTARRCASCHTLKAASANGHVDPDLDTLKPSEAQLAKQVNNGGGSMPACKDQLSSKQIQQVAAYVAKVAER